MKARTAAYIIREGFASAFRNGRSFASSCSIVAASLAVIGLFVMAAHNIDYNASSLGEKPQIQVFLRYELGEADARDIAAILQTESGIREFEYVDKETAYERSKELLGDNSGMLEGIGPDFLPISFIVRMEDPDMIEPFVETARAIDGVDDVAYEKQTIALISSVWRWAKAFGALLAVIPMLLAAFIMTNAIKMAVYERRAEISVMRYIGATERLIKWPFIIEGVVLGLFGACAAFILTGVGYALVESRVEAAISELTGGLFHLAPISDLSAQLIAIYAAIGVGVGVAGSARSVSKYLKA